MRELDASDVRRDSGSNVVDTTALFQWVQRTVGLFAVDLEDALRDLTSQSLSGTDDLHERLQCQRELLSVLPPLNLVTVGATKAGKSTLVNAMLSRPGWKSQADFHEVDHLASHWMLVEMSTTSLKFRHYDGLEIHGSYYHRGIFGVLLVFSRSPS